MARGVRVKILCDEPRPHLHLEESAGPPNLRCKDEISLWPIPHHLDELMPNDHEWGPWALYLEPGP